MKQNERKTHEPVSTSSPRTGAGTTVAAPRFEGGVTSGVSGRRTGRFFTEEQYAEHYLLASVSGMVRFWLRVSRGESEAAIRENASTMLREMIAMDGRDRFLAGIAAGDRATGNKTDLSGIL